MNKKFIFYFAIGLFIFCSILSMATIAYIWHLEKNLDLCATKINIDIMEDHNQTLTLLKKNYTPIYKNIFSNETLGCLLDRYITKSEVLVFMVSVANLILSFCCFLILNIFIMWKNQKKV